MEWNGMEWNGMEWNGMESGVVGVSFQLGGSDRSKWSPITFARSHSELQI